MRNEAKQKSTEIDAFVIVTHRTKRIATPHEYVHCSYITTQQSKAALLLPLLRCAAIHKLLCFIENSHCHVLTHTALSLTDQRSLLPPFPAVQFLPLSIFLSAIRFLPTLPHRSTGSDVLVHRNTTLSLPHFIHYSLPHLVVCTPLLLSLFLFTSLHVLIQFTHKQSLSRLSDLALLSLSHF